MTTREGIAAVTKASIQPLLKDDELDIRWLPGNGKTLVLSFSGARLDSGKDDNTNFAVVSSQSRQNHVLFIDDRRRSWYSLPGMVQRITVFVQEFVKEHGIEEISAIGTSMGGFGAILFAVHLPLKHVAAFVPQISLDDETVSDPCWDSHRPFLLADRIMSVVPSILESRARFYVTFGTEDVDDNRQVTFLPKVENLIVHRVANCGHDLPKYLKKAGILNDTIIAKLTGDEKKLADIMDRFAIENWDRQSSLPRRTAAQLRLLTYRISQGFAKPRKAAQ